MSDSILGIVLSVNSVSVDIVPNTLRITLRLILVRTTMSRSQDIYIYPDL